MFTTPSFLRKNTPELLEKLKKLGYVQFAPVLIGDDTLIAAKGEYSTECSKYHNSEHPNVTLRKGFVDCGENEELFLALASLRDDSDYMQWFIASVPVYFDDLKGVEILDDDNYVPKGGFLKCTLHSKEDLEYTFFGLNTPNEIIRRATTQEIIEHFKKEKLWH